MSIYKFSKKQSIYLKCKMFYKEKKNIWNNNIYNNMVIAL